LKKPAAVKKVSAAPAAFCILTKRRGTSLSGPCAQCFDALATAMASLGLKRTRQTPLQRHEPDAFAAIGWCRDCRNGAKENPAVALEIIGTDAGARCESGPTDVAIRYARKPPLDLMAHEDVSGHGSFPVCSPGLLEQHRPSSGPRIAAFP